MAHVLSDETQRQRQPYGVFRVCKQKKKKNRTKMKNIAAYSALRYLVISLPSPRLCLCHADVEFCV